MRSMRVSGCLIVLLALSACTPRQIARAIAEQRAQEDAPSVTATADCTTFTFTVTGYPEGTNVFIEVGAEPPYGFTVGGNYWQFSPTDGGATGTVAIPDNESAVGFEAIIDVGPDRAFDQTVAPC